MSRGMRDAAPAVLRVDAGAAAAATPGDGGGRVAQPAPVYALHDGANGTAASEEL